MKMFQQLTIISTLFIALMLFVSTPIWADETENVKKMTKEKVDIVINILRDENINQEQKKEGILEAIEGLFDFGLMAKLSLGKTHWKALNKEKRKEFSDLFVERLKLSYLDKLDLYTDEEVVIESAKMTNKNRVEVLTYLVSKDDKNEMLYKLYKSKKGEWKVYDVDVLGVSIVQTYRSQFSGILKKESMDQLMKRMRSTDEMGS